MDVLITIRDFFINAIFHGLPTGLTCFILRMGIFLVLGTISLALAWVYIPWRFIVTQTCILFIVFVISLYIPVEEFRQAGEGFLAFSVFLAFLSMIFLPGFLSFWLTPKLGNQLRLKKILRCIVWGLFILQFTTGR